MAAGTINANSNVRFLLGTQANLEGYISGSKTAVNGTFYLTQDSHRLYVGTAEGKAVPVNEGVTSVNNIENLPTANAHAGEFYYVKNGNILCVYNGTQWVQINSNTDTYLTKGDTTVSLDGSVATLTKKFWDNNNTVVEGLTDSYEIEVADGIKIAVNGDRITLTGALIKQFNVSAKDNIANIELEDTFGTKPAFGVKSGSSRVSVTAETANRNVVINVDDMYNTGVAIDNDASNGFKIRVTDGNGAVSADFTPEIKVGHDAGKQETVVFKNGVASLPVYTVAEIDEIKLALNAMTYKGLVNGSGTGGSKDWDNIVASTTVSIGDTYLFSEDTTFTYSNKQVSVTKGTLAIARGTEGTNGYITSNSLVWDFVESTTDTDTKYKLNTIATTSSTPGSVQLQGLIGGATESKEKIIFADGTAIKANVARAENGDATIQFNHENYVATKSSTTLSQNKAAFQSSQGYSQNTTEITAIESITTNDQGHVTAIATKKITLTDTNATVHAIGTKFNKIENNGGMAVLTNSIQLKDGTGGLMTAVTSDWNMKSSTLTFKGTAGSNTLEVDLMWGTFS